MVAKHVGHIVGLISIPALVAAVDARVWAME
jgi:hypothetical protein